MSSLFTRAVEKQELELSENCAQHGRHYRSKYVTGKRDGYYDQIGGMLILVKKALFT